MAVYLFGFVGNAPAFHDEIVMLRYSIWYEQLGTVQYSNWVFLIGDSLEFRLNSIYQIHAHFAEHLSHDN